MLMRYATLEPVLPRFLKRPLFGDRSKFGLAIRADDPCWQEWERVQEVAYRETQKKSVGNTVNDAGYRVMAGFDLDGKRVLEIGPGEIGHLPFWHGKPAHVTLADCRQGWLDHSAAQLTEHGVPFETRLVDRRQSDRLPFADGEFDVIVSFYVLEHLYPLRPAITELTRILRSGGHLIGAIPAEGGLAWGLGRFLTSRRWFRRHTTIDYDKIICWEHPNFAAQVLYELDLHLSRRRVSYWPMGAPSIDLNLVVKFLYQKSAASGAVPTSERCVHAAA